MKRESERKKGQREREGHGEAANGGTPRGGRPHRASRAGPCAAWEVAESRVQDLHGSSPPPTRPLPPPRPGPARSGSPRPARPAPAGGPWSAPVLSRGDTTMGLQRIGRKQHFSASQQGLLPASSFLTSTAPQIKSFCLAVSLLSRIFCT